MRILVLNSGSSSIKYQLIDMEDESVPLRGNVEGLDRDGGHAQGIEKVFSSLGNEKPDAIGHRVVHGGRAFTKPALVDQAVCEAIAAQIPLAPLHNPANLAGISAALERLPGVPQVAVFDTAFHHTLSELASQYPLPAELTQKHGIRRYGFHGTSCAWALSESSRQLGQRPRKLNLIVAHLGAGASVTAIREGLSVETSMGMTPLEGVMMQTRSGSIDPGVLVQLLRTGMSVDELDELLNHGSGMKGVTGEADMKTVAARAAQGDELAVFARGMYCDRMAKQIGAFAGSAWPLHALVFTGGIGENDAGVREGVLSRLSYLTIPVVLVVAANEELQIARETRDLLIA